VRERSDNRANHHPTRVGEISDCARRVGVANRLSRSRCRTPRPAVRARISHAARCYGHGNCCARDMAMRKSSSAKTRKTSTTRRSRTARSSGSRGKSSSARSSSSRAKSSTSRGSRSASRARGSSGRYGDAASAKVERSMHEMKRGQLRSGGSGKKVTSRKQAIAIGLSEARRAGAKVPRPRKSR